MKKRSQEVEQLILCLDDVSSQVSRDVTNLNEALESSASQSENRIDALIQKSNEIRVRIYNFSFSLQATVFFKLDTCILCGWLQGQTIISQAQRIFLAAESMRQANSSSGYKVTFHFRTQKSVVSLIFKNRHSGCHGHGIIAIT